MSVLTEAAFVPRESPPIRTGDAWPRATLTGEAFASELLLHLLGMANTAAVVLDSRCRVVCATRGAQPILERQDAFAVTRGLLELRGTAAGELQRMMSALLRTGEPQAALLARRNSREPYRAIVRLLRLATTSEPLIVLQLHDPERRIDASDALLRRLFRLTPVESALARKLLDGATLVEAGEMLGITTNTARTHMKAILSKSGSRRQVDFLRLLVTTLIALEA
jgi:DNA-binding CsgD family transcriptional regulator